MIKTILRIISMKKGLLGEQSLNRIISVIERYGLPTRIPEYLDRNLIKSYLLTDKKRIGSTTSYILAVDIGEVIISEEVNEEEINAVIS